MTTINRFLHFRHNPDGSRQFTIGVKKGEFAALRDERLRAIILEGVNVRLTDTIEAVELNDTNGITGAYVVAVPTHIQIDANFGPSAFTVQIVSVKVATKVEAEPCLST